MKSVLTVGGMSCAHCKSAIMDALTAVKGVGAVAVDLDNRRVTVDHNDDIPLIRIIEVIEDIGYDVEE